MAPLQSQSQFQKTISNLKQQIQGQIEELNGDDNANGPKRTRKAKQKISVMDSEKWMEYVKQLEDKNEILEHRLEDLQDKFDKYKIKAELRQETFIRREKNYQERDQILNKKLKTVIENHTHDVGDMSRLKELKGHINTRISSIQGDFDSILSKQREAHKEEIEDLIRKYTRELEYERKKNSMEEKDWQDKAIAMKESLEDAVSEAIKLDEQNEKLVKKNKELVISFKAQENDRKMILKNVAMLKREKERLIERIKQLEQEVEYHTTISKQLEEQVIDQKAALNSSGHLDRSNISARSYDSRVHRDHRSEESAARLRKLLDQERKSLKSVRKSHLSLLAERTELEIFLRQCIDDVRTEISQQSGGDDRTFTIDDRKRALELLFSKEKVVNLLYDKIFPFKPKMPQMHQEDDHIDGDFEDEYE